VFLLGLLDVKMKGLQFFETLGTTHALTQPNMPEGKSSGCFLLIC